MTLPIRVIRVNNFFYGLLSESMDHDIRAVLSGRPEERKIGRGLEGKACDGCASTGAFF